VELDRLPPFECFDARKAKVLDEVLHAIRHDCHWCSKPAAAHLANNAAKRRTIQVVHVGVRQQNGIDLRKIGDVKPGEALPPKHDEARGKDGINQKGMAGGLNQKGRMTDEGDGCLGRADLRRPGGATAKRLRMTLAHQTPKLA